MDKSFLGRFYHRWSSITDPLRKKLHPGHIKTFLQLRGGGTMEEVEWYKVQVVLDPPQNILNSSLVVLVYLERIQHHAEPRS